MRYRTGDIVTDAARALTGKVHCVHGDSVILVRPSGHTWEAAVSQCWTASPEERQSLTPRGAVRVINTNGVHDMAKHGGGTGSGQGGSQQDDSSSGRGHGGGGSETSGGNPSDGSGPAK
ncbi:hypothetical protein [Streptomyces sp. NPDC051909]|uniref:hypothetical protein n=1 Tax=Streptomyces sp. NPDC051909 TaxID=3154944 RepID=UPI003423ADBF